MQHVSINPQALSQYLARLHGSPIQGLMLTPVGQLSTDPVSGGKGYSYRKPLKLTYFIGKTAHQRVLHMADPAAG